jgi:membrane fusion protein (multidrug efflux system)
MSSAPGNGRSHESDAPVALAERDALIPSTPEFSRANQIATRKTSRKRPVLLGLLLVLMVGGAIAGTLYWLHARQFESTDDAAIEGRVIPISPQVPARVQAVRVEDNSPVHKGDVLVELDPTDYRVALEQARATEAAARGRLDEAKAQIAAATAGRDEAEADIAVAEANAGNAASDLKRYQDVAESNPAAVSKQQLGNVVATQRSTQALVAQAKAKLAAAEAKTLTAQAAVEGAQGDLAKASADVHRADVNLTYCTITAPEDGRITRKNVEPGSYVQTGQALLALVPPDVWVTANFKETQLEQVRPGQSVNVTVDAYPAQRFTGKVDSIQSGTGSRFSVLPAENATGNFVKVVQRVPVKITLDPGQAQDKDRVLAPGMSVVPEVKVR